MTRTSTFRTAAVLGGFLLAILMIMTVSRAAFSDTTVNPGNTWEAGSVELVDDQSGTAMFTETDLAPGDGGSHCITVTYLGSIGADVVLSTVSTAGSTGLAPALDLAITEYDVCGGTPAATVFSGTLAGADGAAFNGGWAAATAGESRGYLIEWSLPGSVDNSYQGTGAVAAFTWQATSN